VRFTVVGEALIDLAAAADEDGSYLARPGGSPLNVAVGLARLGQPTAFAGRMSADPLATILRDHLRKSAVDLRYVTTGPEPSTVALVELTGGQARYEFSAGGADFQWSPGELAFLPAGARALHFGSLTSWLAPGDRAVAAAVRRVRDTGSVLVSYDPNVRPGLQPDAAAARRQVEQSVSLAHVVKASAEDLDWLYPGEQAGVVARHWLELGAGLVVVTSGADGATGWTRQHPTVGRPSYPARVADTVGAGDAFTSGLLDSLARHALLDPARLLAALDPQVLGEVIDAASMVAAITCSRPGANPPWRAELDALAGTG
jgi:fructokinase